MNVILIDPMTPYDDQINLGVVYLASYLDSIGHKVRVVDMNFRRSDAYQRLDKAITELKPEIVGISIMTYFAFGEINRLLTKIKTENKAKIVVGGASPSLFAEQMMVDNPDIDFAVIGEGELTLGDLVATMAHGGNYGSVLGLAYRDNYRVVVNAARPFIEDLDSLPMLNFNLIDIVPKYGFVYYRDTFTMATSRGCPYACSFCLSSVLTKRRWRAFSAKRVVDEIENGYCQYGLTRISFQDDNFVMRPQRVVEICRMIRERGWKIRLCLEGGIRADRLTNESLKELCATGLECGFLGVESGAPKVFEMINKGETLGEIETALLELKAANIDLQIYMILGLPGDTHETFLESMSFAKKYGVKCRWHFAFPFEGTRMYEYVEKNGRFIRNCKGYNLDIVTGNDITTPGTMPLAFDTLEYPKQQRIDDYYRAVIDSGTKLEYLERELSKALSETTSVST